MTLLFRRPQLNRFHWKAPDKLELLLALVLSASVPIAPPIEKAG
jgi:hypothetical protein